MLTHDKTHWREAQRKTEYLFRNKTYPCQKDTRKQTRLRKIWWKSSGESKHTIFFMSLSRNVFNLFKTVCAASKKKKEKKKSSSVKEKQWKKGKRASPIAHLSSRSPEQKRTGMTFRRWSNSNTQKQSITANNDASFI